MSKLKNLDIKENVDYEKLGLKCGLEIHQQLNTGKLFCNCASAIVSNSNLNKQTKRKLRFSLSEEGEIDSAANFEFKKGKYNVYKYNDQTCCLVDLDEQPPIGPNKLALDTAFKVGLMFNLNFFSKTQFMRKLIIDGSITSGFQRTAIIGVGGVLNTSFGEVKIEGVNLEEDSCRTLEREDGHTIFALDRQGIPLIEITTGPQIKTAAQGYEVAYQLGNLLRSFNETKRGLGTIRQDLNVSINRGARVEIKGAQNLKMIPQIIDAEIKRQEIHLSIIDEIKERGINCENFTDWEVYDICDIFKDSTSKVILSNLEGKNRGVYGVKLFKFKNILGHECQENYRFATEVSDRNKKHFPEIKGLFHSDELPKYGITSDEVEKIRVKLKLLEKDSFILIANEKEVAQKSLQNVLEIISELLVEVPSEVRQVDSKGTQTLFLRPMPGSARMYPETDIEEIIITNDYLSKLKKQLPELYDKKLERLSKEFSLEDSRVEEMILNYSEDEIKNLIKISNKGASNIYNILFEIPKDIKKRESIEPIDFKYELLENILKAAKDDLINQKTIRDLFISLYRDNLDNVSNLKEYLEKKGLLSQKIDLKDIEAKLKILIEKNKGAPSSALMGIAMKEFNGLVDGKILSQLLKKLLSN